jgi:F0F1-type ATP synthase delta subunit
VELKLPTNVVSQVDVARILREINGLNDFFAGAAKRQSGTPMQLPKLTRLLDQVASENSLNLLEEKDRKMLVEQLNLVLGKAPLLHISFAAEPSPKSLERVLIWFRQNIHPQTLLQVGLQPTIAAGCVLRTPNKLFDMSLRSYLKEQEPYLVQLINGASNRNG